jgi:hypothetical protein
MNVETTINVEAPKKSRKKGVSKNRKLIPTGYMLRDGRRVQMVPWVGQGAQPWKAGYARVFIPFTASELKSARHNGVRGHEQIVKVSNLKRC